MDESKTISKGRLYDAFLEVTVRYLNEMISALSLERAIIKELGEDRGNELIEKIATSNPSLQNLDAENSTADDYREKIDNLLSYIDCEFRTE